MLTSTLPSQDKPGGSATLIGLVIGIIPFVVTAAAGVLRLRRRVIIVIPLQHVHIRRFSFVSAAAIAVAEGCQENRWMLLHNPPEVRFQRLDEIRAQTRVRMGIAATIISHDPLQTFPRIRVFQDDDQHLDVAVRQFAHLCSWLAYDRTIFRVEVVAAAGFLLNSTVDIA